MNGGTAARQEIPVENDDISEYLPDGMEFWNISLDGLVYPAARGVMYAKPSPLTVKARLLFPRLEPAPPLRKGGRFRLSAQCGKKTWMRGIQADILEAENRPDGSRTAELLLHRKRPDIHR